MFRHHLSARSTLALFDAIHDVAVHAHKINTNHPLRSKLQELGSVTQMQDPPLLRLENESYQLCLTFLHNLMTDKPENNGGSQVESYLVELCLEVLEIYVETATSGHRANMVFTGQTYWMIPLGSGKQRELAARAPVIVATLEAICAMAESSFEENLDGFFPLLSSLVSCEHGSTDVQAALNEMLTSSVGPVLLRSC